MESVVRDDHISRYINCMYETVAGTTWHTAGLVWDLGRTDVDTELVSRTVRMLRQLEEDTGVNPGWINNGGLFVASTKV